MSNSRSPEDRMEKHRISIKRDTVEMNFISTLRRLKLDTNNWGESRLLVREAMLAVTINHDFSGEDCDD